MNAIITSFSLKKLVMWNKVRELKSFGLNKSQISRELGLHRDTVARYLSMRNPSTSLAIAIVEPINTN